LVKIEHFKNINKATVATVNLCEVSPYNVAFACDWQNQRGYKPIYRGTHLKDNEGFEANWM